MHRCVGLVEPPYWPWPWPPAVVSWRRMDVLLLCCVGIGRGVRGDCRAYFNLVGCMSKDHKEAFSCWWLKEFKTVTFPEDMTVFDVMVDEETGNTYARMVEHKGLGDGGDAEWLVMDAANEMRSDHGGSILRANH